MVYDIFTNVTIVLSFLLVIGQFFKHNDFDSRQALKTQMVLALIFGALGVVLMLFTIVLTDTLVIIDMRNVAIICAGILGGPVSSILTSIIIGVFRIIKFGVNTASITASFIALLVGVGTACISITKMSRRIKMLAMALFSMVAANAALFYLIMDRSKLMEALAYTWVFNLFGLVLAYYTLEYILSANGNLRMKEKIEEELKVSNARLEAIVDNAGVGIVLRDRQGNVTGVNQAYLDMIGYSREDGYRFEDIIHPEDINKTKEIMEGLSTGKYNSFKTELRYLNKNKQIIYAEVTSTVIPSMGNMASSVIYIVNNITERKKMEEELERAKLEAERAASTDFLTGIMNRRAFIDRLQAEFHRIEREKSSLSLILADIDYFKKINDTHGHQAGDFALKKFVQCLSEVCRPYDFMGRHGGEEFLICLPNTPQEQAMEVAERMRAAVENMRVELSETGESIRFTASFGVASHVDGDENNIDSLIVQADNAMYKAKKLGRNLVCSIAS